MMRKLAVALSLASLLGAGVVQALGLGEASVESTLNQPLKAEIELVNIRDLEDNEILPGLASREEFLKAGVERIYFLSDVRFEVQRNEEGKMVVQLTTSKPVREPFLNFLVEVIWPSGRLLREYALLIDPPIYGEEPLAPVQQVESAPTSTVSQLPEIDVIDEAPVRQESTVSSAQQSAAPTNVPQQGDIYGPTNNSDTMWAIALKVRPDSSVTAQQTMLAIQDMNPDSFINGNINSLKKGQILRLPNLNDIRQRSKRDAVRGVIAQNRDFEKRALGKNVVDATPQVEAPVPAPTAEPVNTGDELKLVVADNAAKDSQSGAHAGEAANDGSADALKNNLAVTLEKLDQASLEKEELSSRVKDLEEQLETLQRLLTLKDDQLANLQTQMGKEDESAAEGVPDAVIAAENAQVDDVAATDMAATETNEADSANLNPADSDVSEAEAGVETAQDTAAADEAQTGADSTGAEKDMTSVADGASPAVTPATPKATTVPPVATPPVEEKLTVQSIVDMVMKNPMYQLIAGGVVILLLLVVWGLSRRNAQKEQEFFETRNENGEEPGDVFEVEDMLGDETVETDAEEMGGSAEDTELQAQPETEDVIAEADIYIAYGRLDQASQLLESAISSEPQRTDIRLKLLEVYAESNEVESFNKQFNEVEAMKDDYAMEQALEIKSRLSDSDEMVSIDDLENQLLADDAEPAVEEPSEKQPTLEELEAEELEAKKDEIIAIDYEPTEINNADDAVDETISIDEELSNLESDLAADGVEQTLIETEDDLDIDFDINEIDLDLDDTATEEAAPIEFSLDSDDSNVEQEADLELDLSDEIDLDSTQQDEVDTVEDNHLDLDVDNLGLDEELSNNDGELNDLDGELTDLDGELTDIDSELSDIDTELSDLDSELDEMSLELEESADESVLESSDTEESSADSLEDDLNLDDLDLELDKIDSDLDVNFELDETSDAAESADSEAMSSESAVEELEDIADTLAADTAESEDVSVAADDVSLDEDLDVELDLDPDLDLDIEQDALETSDSSAETGLLQGEESDGLDIEESVLDLDDGVLDLDDSAVELDDSAVELDDGTVELDDSVLDVDDSVADESGFESGLSDDEDFDFLAGTDEAATKLDLARAYIDMGDGDGAKDILEEVALEGSEEQKQEAQDLLKTLD